MTVEEKNPQFVDYSGLPVISNGMEECYWCNRVLDKTKMTMAKQYGVTVYVCKNCGGG